MKPLSSLRPVQGICCGKRRPRFWVSYVIGVAPFPLVEAQVKAILAAFSNPEKLDQIGEAVEVMNRYQELRTRLWDSNSAPGEEETLVKTGEAEQCVRGVGHGGKYEWVELMRWMVKKGEEEDLEAQARL